MTQGLQALIDCGTRLWLDSVDPGEVADNKKLGITGATSNPAIIAGLVNTGRFDDMIQAFIDQDLGDEDIAWAVTDRLVADAQAQFHDIWQSTNGNDGWVSFELDPLLEDPANTQPLQQRIDRYIELGKKWAAGHDNRMIKVPATEAGLGAIEELAAAGITLNVTLIFSERQYLAARDAVWRGRQRYGKLDTFKSVYSIFISRVDVYTAKQVAELSDAAQGLMGIVNAKQIGAKNSAFWADKDTTNAQEMIWASTGKKLDWQPEDYYVEALAGSDIQTNPPETNDAVQALAKSYTARSRELPDAKIVDELAAKVDVQKMEAFLMAEGVAKFADPHKKLIQTIADKRQALSAAS